MLNNRIVKVFNSGDQDLPKYETNGACACDVRSSVDVVIDPGKTVAVGTGLHMEIPIGYKVEVYPRSGLSAKTPLRVANSVGQIDSDYRGELKVLLHNTGDEPQKITKGDRVAQLAILPVFTISWHRVSNLSELSDTDRGHGGFGSTGAK